MKLLHHVIKMSGNFHPCGKLCIQRHFSTQVKQSKHLFNQCLNSKHINRNVILNSEKCSSLKQCLLNRYITTSSKMTARTNVGVGSSPHHVDDHLPQDHHYHNEADKTSSSIPDSAWLLRLANENGFLSFCRNTYLASAVACGMQAEGAFEVSQVAAQGVFMLAGFNLIWGTTTFVIHILTLRRRIHMSFLGALVNIAGAVLHLFVWLTLVVMYLGLTEEPPEEHQEQIGRGEDV